jgi:hypothetical protein
MMAKARKSGTLGRGDTAGEEKGVVSIDQVARDYPDEWVLLKVTAFDDDHVPARGRLIAHGSNHERIWDTFAQMVSPGEKLDMPYFIFQAGQRISSGARRALAEAGEEGAAGAWREWVASSSKPGSTPKAGGSSFHLRLPMLLRL